MIKNIPGLPLTPKAHGAQPNNFLLKQLVTEYLTIGTRAGMKRRQVIFINLFVLYCIS